MAKKEKKEKPGKAKHYKDLMRLNDSPLFDEKGAEAHEKMHMGGLVQHPDELKPLASNPAHATHNEQNVEEVKMQKMAKGGLVDAGAADMDAMTKDPEAQELADVEDGEGSNYESNKMLAQHHSKLAAHYQGLVDDQEPGQEEEFSRMMKDHKQFDQLNALTKNPSKKV